MNKTPELSPDALDKGRLPLTQYKFAVFCFIQSSSILLATTAHTTKYNEWISIIFGAIMSFPVILMFSSLMSSFPKLNLFQINDLVYGKVAGKIISAIYLWHFLTLTSLNLRELGDFVGYDILTRTPLAVILAVFMFVCALAVRKGLVVVTKYAPLIAIAVSFIFFLTVVLLLRIIDLENLLPVFDLPVIKYVQSANLIATIPLAELYVFLMITPNIDFKGPEIKKATLGGFFAGVVYFLLIALRDICVHGAAISLLKFPAFETHKLIGFTEYRADILFGMVFVSFLYFKVSLLYYITVRAIAQLFKLKAYKPLVFITGALAIVYSITLFETVTEDAEIRQGTAPIAWIFIEILLPLITLLLAKARKLPQKIGGGEA